MNKDIDYQALERAWDPQHSYGRTDRQSYGQTGMGGSTRLVILTKNIYTL